MLRRRLSLPCCFALLCALHANRLRPCRSRVRLIPSATLLVACRPVRGARGPRCLRPGIPRHPRIGCLRHILAAAAQGGQEPCARTRSHCTQLAATHAGCARPAQCNVQGSCSCPNVNVFTECPSTPVQLTCCCFNPSLAGQPGSSGRVLPAANNHRAGGRAGRGGDWYRRRPGWERPATCMMPH